MEPAETEASTPALLRRLDSSNEKFIEISLRHPRGAEIAGGQIAPANVLGDILAGGFACQGLRVLAGVERAEARMGGPESRTRGFCEWLRYRRTACRWSH